MPFFGPGEPPRFEGGFGRIHKGDRVTLVFAAAPGTVYFAGGADFSTQSIGVSIDVVYDDGTDGELFIQPTLLSASIADRAVRSIAGNPKTDTAPRNGTIVGGIVTGQLSGIPRGALCTVIATLQGQGSSSFRVWGKGYSYNSHPVVVGEMGEWGPGGGSGFIRTIDLGNPAANAQVTEQTVPTNAVWFVRTMHVPMTAASANVRQWVVEYTDGTDILVQAKAGSTLAANDVVTMDAGIGLVAIGTLGGNNDEIALPETPLREGFTVAPVLQNIGALDDIGDGQMLVEEWVVP